LSCVDEHVNECKHCRELVGALASMHGKRSKGGLASNGPLPGRNRWLRQGTAVGRYMVLGPLGAGAMGVVYSAQDPKLDRKVALKMVRLDSATPGRREALHARLLREAQAIARVNHPNVVGVFDAGVYEDRVFLAMELVEGSTLT